MRFAGEDIVVKLLRPIFIALAGACVNRFSQSKKVGVKQCEILFYFGTGQDCFIEGLQHGGARVLDSFRRVNERDRTAALLGQSQFCGGADGSLGRCEGRIRIQGFGLEQSVDVPARQSLVLRAQQVDQDLDADRGYSVVGKQGRELAGDCIIQESREGQRRKRSFTTTSLPPWAAGGRTPHSR